MTAKVALVFMVLTLIGLLVVVHVATKDLARYRSACAAHGGTTLREGCYVIRHEFTLRELGLEP